MCEAMLFRLLQVQLSQITQESIRFHVNPYVINVESHGFCKKDRLFQTRLSCFSCTSLPAMYTCSCIKLHNFPECNIHLLLHVVPEKGWNPANIHDCVIGLNLDKFRGMLRYMYSLESNRSSVFTLL